MDYNKLLEELSYSDDPHGKIQIRVSKMSTDPGPQNTFSEGLSVYIYLSCRDLIYWPILLQFATMSFFNS